MMLAWMTVLVAMLTPHWLLALMTALLVILTLDRAALLVPNPQSTLLSFWHSQCVQSLGCLHF
jgi:hypothetical protein